MSNVAAIPRRRFLKLVATTVPAICGLVLAGVPSLRAAAAESTKIGIVGAGKMGGTLAELSAKAGHEVMISSRHPEELKAQAQAIGPKVHVGTVREAAAFGPVVVIAMPYGKWPEIGAEIKSETVGKTVIDLTNRIPTATARWPSRRARRPPASRIRSTCPARISCARSTPSSIRICAAKPIAQESRLRSRWPATTQTRSPSRASSCATRVSSP